MGEDRLLTISSFGRAVGLPSSALRHYARAGVLAPAEVDPVSGYRYYAPAQLRHGRLVARLREAGVPLDLVRQVVAVEPAAGADLLERLAGDLAGESAGRLRLLGEVVARLRSVVGGPTRTVRVPGPVLARAVQAVLRTAETAAADVAGVVWELGGTGLSVAGTDRYWLAHCVVPVHSAGPPVSAFTAGDATRAAAAAVARRPSVEVGVSTSGIRLRQADQAPIAELHGGDRVVPDLGLLVARQPVRQVLTGFARRPLLQLLTSLEPDGPTGLRIRGHHASIGSAASSLTGWASTARPGGTEVLVRPSLLAAAVDAGVGPEVLIGVAGAGEPLTVTSPDQPGLAALVMPMRP